MPDDDNEKLREGVRLFTERAVAKIEAGRAEVNRLRAKDELTSAEAATVLHATQAYVEELIGKDDLSLTPRKTLMTSDVLEYKAARDERIRASFQRLAELSEESSGGYI